MAVTQFQWLYDLPVKVFWILFPMNHMFLFRIKISPTHIHKPVPVMRNRFKLRFYFLQILIMVLPAAVCKYSLFGQHGDPLKTNNERQACNFPAWNLADELIIIWNYDLLFFLRYLFYRSCCSLFVWKHLCSRKRLYRIKQTKRMATDQKNILIALMKATCKETTANCSGFLFSTCVSSLSFLSLLSLSFMWCETLISLQRKYWICRNGICIKCCIW